VEEGYSGKSIGCCLECRVSEEEFMKFSFGVFQRIVARIVFICFLFLIVIKIDYQRYFKEVTRKIQAIYYLIWSL